MKRREGYWIFREQRGSRQDYWAECYDKAKKSGALERDAVDYARSATADKFNPPLWAC